MTGVLAIGSGAPFATAAAKALVDHTDLDAEAIVRAAMDVTAEICIFTNDQHYGRGRAGGGRGSGRTR